MPGVDHRDMEDQLRDWVREARPLEPVLIMRRSVLEASARRFLQGFPGKVLYAVKCNPHRGVLASLSQAGIDAFDVASIPELARVRDVTLSARCYFNHPVKDEVSIRTAHAEYGIEDFTVDCMPELEKVTALAHGASSTVQIRLKVGPGSEIYDFGSKFGAPAGLATALVKEVEGAGLGWALAFHIGSQCEDPTAFARALEQCAGVIAEAGSQPRYVNVGGGFPAPVTGRPIPEVEDFFHTIASAKERLGLPALICEPGRALVSSAGTLVARVVLRNGERLYLNDGQYGCLGEVNYGRFRLSVRLIKRLGPASAEHREFRVFGPTCDSFDALEASLSLPANVETGDWLAISEMGAYSTALAGEFNGFRSERLVVVDWTASGR